MITNQVRRLCRAELVSIDKIAANWKSIAMRMFSSKSDSGNLKVDGNVSLYWERHGTGPHAVLCCPGLLGTVETNYGPLFKAANSEKFTFVGVDPIGCGKSRPPDRHIISTNGEFFAERDAQQAAKVMQELGYDSYSIVGWSTGALAAAEVGILYPDRIKKAVLCNAPFKTTTITKQGAGKVGNLKSWPAEARQDIIRVFGETYAQKLLADWRLFLYQEIEESKHLRKMYGELSRIKAPTLLIYGTQDHFTDVVSILAVFEDMKTSRLHPIACAGHFFFDFMDEFVSTTLKFLQKP